MNALIVYYTGTGNTEMVAKNLEAVLKSRGHTVAVNKMSSRGVARSFLGKGYQALFGRPLKPEGVALDVSGFELICIGSPVWAGNAAPPVKGYILECTGMKGKDVILFLTYGGAPGVRGLVKKLTKMLEMKEPASIRTVYFSARDLKFPEKVMNRFKEMI